MEESLLFINAHLISETRDIPGGYLLVRGGKVASSGQGHHPAARGAEVIDLGGDYLSPGFIDLHVNGAAGRDLLEGEAEAVEAVARFLAEHGTTSFLPTLVSSPPELTLRACRAIGDAARRSERAAPSAEVLGLHLEGPFINPRMRGAHSEGALRPLREEELSACRRALMGGEGKTPFPFVVTLAPELPGALDLIGRLSKGGFIPAIGHTEASYEEAKEAIKAGARYAVHIFNRYPPFHHRSPGAALAALLDEAVSCELIADGLHLHPAALELIFRIKAPLGMVLVSDSISLTGSGRSEGYLGSRRVILKEGRAVTEEGELAGSVIALHEGFVNLRRFLKLSPREVIPAATSNPARVLGLGGRKGSLEPGADADLVVLRREDLCLLRTLVKGREVLPRGASS